MKTSFEFGEYRKNLAKEIKETRKAGGRDEAKKTLEQAKEDLRYQISKKLHQLEQDLAKKGEIVELVESKEQLPPDWEREDITEKMPEWIKLFIDFERIRVFADQKDHDLLKLGTKLAYLYFPSDFQDEYLQESLKEILENESESSNAHNLRTFFFNDRIYRMVAEHAAQYVNELTHGKFLGETIQPDGRIVVNSYSHVVGGYTEAANKASHEYLLNDTIGNPRQFKVGSEIGRSASDGFNKIWVHSLSRNKSAYLDFGKPLVLFSAENPAIASALERNSRLESPYEEYEVPKMTEDHKLVANKIESRSTGLLLDLKDQVYNNISRQWEDKYPLTWQNYADTVVDLSRGEILHHKYNQNNNE